MTNKKYPPNKISSYFYTQIPTLVIITITGIFYNIGMIASPWFEGKMAQYLSDILLGNRENFDMIKLVIAYLLTIFLVQSFRYFKRYYVRKFANHIRRRMKKTIYNNLVHQSKAKTEQERIGSLMTKALLDADACSEGMRKFTTEIFDTGVVMISYLAMLFYYDYRLTLLIMIFPPFAYFIAERLKVFVTLTTTKAKKSADKLNGATIDRIQNALTYRVYGQEQQQNVQYEKYLHDYESKSIHSNLWESTMQPFYQIIAMVGTILILWLGSRNVLHEGWCEWDIAAFSTYFSCFLKLAVKSSKSAKLFNSVQKAKVSWKRIQPYLEGKNEEEFKGHEKIHLLEVKNLSFHYPNSQSIFTDVNFKVETGQIFGISGEVACGKSTLGKVFLNEYPYNGKILLDGKELSKLKNNQLIGYLGHDPELMSGTIQENICMGEDKDPIPYLKMVCLDEEVIKMPQGLETQIGDNNIALSGGQQKRLALCRTLYHKRDILILDDPFSAVDFETENEIIHQLRIHYNDCIILLISHRLRIFNELDGILWIKDGIVISSTHEQLMKESLVYRKLYDMQMGGVKDEQSI